MTRKRRPDLVIQMDILAALVDGPKIPTHLTQICNLSFDNLVKFLEQLESRKFIKRTTERGHDMYSITPEGLLLNSDFRSVIRRMNP